MGKNEIYTEPSQKVSEALKILDRYQNQAFKGYMTMRETIFKTGEKGHIPDKYKHLFFAMFDLARNFPDGTKHHVRLAIDDGLTLEELTEGMIMVLLLTGIPSFLLGSEVLPWAEGYIKQKTNEG
jgi:alkylhydroperoxidase/carboxymuconolactone decarboxylase family protein YurZ